VSATTTVTDGSTFSKPISLTTLATSTTTTETALFTDVTFSSGIGINNRYVALGLRLCRYDNDGWQDIIQINGHVYPEIDQHDIGQTFKNPRLVYKNQGDGRFKDVSAEMGPGISEHFSSRGASVRRLRQRWRHRRAGLNLSDPPSLLRNDGGNSKNWIKIKLIGTQCNRTAIGARVRVVTGKHSQMDESTAAPASCRNATSASTLPGQAQVADGIEVNGLPRKRQNAHPSEGQPDLTIAKAAES